MQMKKMAVVLAVSCAVTMLTGCGVPQEEHDAKVAELNTAWAEIEGLKGKVADLESVLEKEKARVRAYRIELDDASQRIKGLQTSEAKTASALADEKVKVASLESEVVSSKSAMVASQDMAIELEAELAELKDEYETLQRRFDQFNNNMKALNGTTTQNTMDPSLSDAEAAMELLDQMSDQ